MHRALLRNTEFRYKHLMAKWLERAQALDWESHRRFLQKERYRPMYDRAFGEFLAKGMDSALAHHPSLKPEFLAEFDQWLHGGKLNKLSGLSAFPHRDFICGVTHALDDLHITFGSQLVCLEKEYAYHKRMKPEFVHRNLSTLATGDVLVLGVPFAYYGGLHPETSEVLDRCLQLDIPVHIDAAWFGCMRDFSFCFDHPAIRTVSFSLSKGLGLGSHRAGVRYARDRHRGPVTIVNDFGMEVNSVMACGLRFMKEFGADYLQNRYGDAYAYTCEKLKLRPTQAIHMAFAEDSSGIWYPNGVRPFLRYLVDEVNEFSS